MLDVDKLTGLERLILEFSLTDRKQLLLDAAIAWNPDTRAAEVRAVFNEEIDVIVGLLNQLEVL